MRHLTPKSSGVRVGLLALSLCFSLFAKESAPAQTSRSQTGTASLAVSITLEQSALTQTQIQEALEMEFGVPLKKAQGSSGLRLRVNGRSLHASYQDRDGEIIERKVELPEDKEQQLSTLVLVSGNLGRDEAGAILVDLQAAEGAPDLVTESEASEKSGPEEKANEKATEEKTEKQEVPPEKTEESLSEERDIEHTEVSFSFYGDISTPSDLKWKRTDFELGLAYSDVGNVGGFALNLGVLNNRGLGLKEKATGAQIGLLWLDSNAYFRGFSASAIGVTARGGFEGAQAAAIFTWQKHASSGALLGGIVSASSGEVTGAQLAGFTSLSWGDHEGAQMSGVVSLLEGSLRGFQGAGAVALASGDLSGAQVAGGFAFAGKKLDGFQGSLVTAARSVDGVQAGAVNVSYQDLKGIQAGVANFASESSGAQVGLVNIAGQAKGTQVGLVNVAKDLDGTPIGLLNFIPGMRNQLVVYGSYSPNPEGEGLPSGPLTHIAWKVFPDPFYSQLSFGLGQGSSGGVEYAPGIAMGFRGRITRGFFVEADAQYQFEKTFDSSTAHQHGILGRAAFGYEFAESFSVFVGGGPRLNIRTGLGTTEYSAAPHGFAGIQVF